MERLFITLRVRETDTFASFSRLLELKIRCAVVDLPRTSLTLVFQWVEPCPSRKGYFLQVFEQTVAHGC